MKIMLPWDPTGKNGPKNPLPDNVCVVNPKDDTPTSDVKPLGPLEMHQQPIIPSVA